MVEKCWLAAVPKGGPGSRYNQAARAAVGMPRGLLPPEQIPLTGKLLFQDTGCAIAPGPADGSIADWRRQVP